MCGIVGYVGDRDCTDVLVSALSKLEYRGYDSAGIAVFENNEIVVEKCKGCLAELERKLLNEHKPIGHCGIGHTRWATHGEPSDVNSHPHGNATVCQTVLLLYNKRSSFYILCIAKAFSAPPAQQVVSLYNNNDRHSVKCRVPVFSAKPLKNL